ncbi:MAG: YegS/Rv2252/BmrU family lipid kinase [Clostridium sp.]
MREKHYFIVNPLAGKKDRTSEIQDKVESFFKIYKEKQYEIYVTKSKCDATRFVKEECYKNPNHSLYFYSCGGDGTLNEVVNGAANYDNAIVSVIPYGSGNDFVRNFKDDVDFFDMDSILNGEVIDVDLIKVLDRYSVNICNVGFDAKVAHNMNMFKKLPLVSGEFSYNLSVLYCLLNTLSSKFKITLDDDKVFEDDFLLSAIANGKCYGGGYKGVPLAEISDGYIDICAIRTVSRFKLLSLLNLYKEGKHVGNEEVKKYVIYEKCKKVKIESEKYFTICIDGETYIDKSVEFNICEKKIKFLLPSNVNNIKENHLIEVTIGNS